MCGAFLVTLETITVQIGSGKLRCLTCIFTNFRIMELENLNPNVYKKLDDRKSGAADWDDGVDDPFDEREVFGELKP